MTIQKKSKSRLKLSRGAKNQLQAEAWKEAKRRVGLLKNQKYEQFKARYFNDRVAFVHDCFEWKEGKGPTFYQDEILASFEVNPRQSVRGPHGLGKTTISAWAILHFALTRDGMDWKCPTTASVWRQLTKFLWPEVRKWQRMLRWDVVGREKFDPRLEMQQLNLKLTTGEAFAIASDDKTAIEGAHADQLLYVFDESKAINDDIFDAAEGAFAGAGTGDVEAFALAISTPGEPNGRFYDIHARKPGLEDWSVRHVTLDEAIRAGRISRDWADSRIRMWGESSPVCQNRVFGEFAASSEDSIVPLAYIEAANQRWRKWDEAGRPGVYTQLGVDVGLGGQGSDATVLAPIKDSYLVDELRVHARGDINTATMQTAGRVKGFLDGNQKTTAYIDVIGIGAGVVHRLNEQGYDKRALAFNVAEKTEAKDTSGELRFSNKRSAMWWKMREALAPDSPIKIALPPDDRLTGDLTAPKYKVLSGGIIQVEKKIDIRKRLKRSTDYADATLQGLFGPELVKAAITKIYKVGQGYIEKESSDG